MDPFAEVVVPVAEVVDPFAEVVVPVAEVVVPFAEALHGIDVDLAPIRSDATVDDRCEEIHAYCV